MIDDLRKAIGRAIYELENASIYIKVMLDDRAARYEAKQELHKFGMEKRDYENAKEAIFNLGRALDQHRNAVADAVAAEREACAEVAEAAMSDDNKYQIADAIRARQTNEPTRNQDLCAND